VAREDAEDGVWRPSLDLVAVPSSAIMARSMPTWSRASQPTRAGAIVAFTLPTAFKPRLAQVALLVAVAEFEGLVFAGGGGRRARRRGRACRSEAERRLRTVGLPRESRISRAVMAVMVVFMAEEKGFQRQ